MNKKHKPLKLTRETHKVLSIGSMKKIEGRGIVIDLPSNSIIKGCQHFTRVVIDGTSIHLALISE